MPKRKIDVIEEVKKKYVRMALETGRQASIARKAGISSKTLRKWIREYEGEIREAMESEESPTLPDQP
ncbi:MAG: transposase, partial [Sporolactobacillus sp.]|nr:transposase [Sporolactobacillus sp.]